MHDLLPLGRNYLISLPRSVKRSIVLVIDVCLCIASTWLAYYLKTDEFVKLSNDFVQAVSLSIALALPIFAANGLYRAVFRYSDWLVSLVIGRAIIFYGLIYLTVVVVVAPTAIPGTIGVIQPLLLFFSVAGSRILASYLLRFNRQNDSQNEVPFKVLIYGAGEAGRQLARHLFVGREMKVIGFLDDDHLLQGHVLNGQPIFSPNNLTHIIKSKGVTHIFIAIPSANRMRHHEILKKLNGHNVNVRTLPSMVDLVRSRVNVSDLRELDIEDLLCRDAVTPDRLLLSKNISGRVVLVTGAGGSIGGELCRQIINFRPKKLLLVDVSEFMLYAIHSELEEICNASNYCEATNILPLLGSAQDEDRMRYIIGRWSPETIYHAAAYKHVPLVESNPIEGIKNNVFGTLTTAQVAIENGVSTFVLVSSDKAVRPTSIMGASKRVSELCLQALDAMQLKETAYDNHSALQAAQPKPTTKMVIVRFGNVLDSSGSVIPKFRKQIRDGGPITLTHPEVNRFFMTIPEAAQLVIQAGAMAKGGDVFVLDMGEPIKIFDLARRMVELSGLAVRDELKPDGDIDILITGLRPGEKLYEELMIGDDPQPTIHPKIQRAQDTFLPWHELKFELETLKILLSQNNVEAVLVLLQKLVLGFQPSGNRFDGVTSEQNCASQIVGQLDK